MSIVDTKGSGSDGDFLSVMQLLSDPARLKAEYDKLEAQKKDVQRYVDQIGPVTDIMGARQQAIQQSAKAAEELVDARTRAQRLIDDAKARAEVITAEAQRYERDLKEEMKAGMDQMKALLADARRKAEEADKTLMDAKQGALLMRVEVEEQMKFAMDSSSRAFEEMNAYRAKREELERAHALLGETLNVHRSL